MAAETEGWIKTDANPNYQPDAIMELPRDSLTKRFGENSVEEIKSCHAFVHMAPFIAVVWDMWRVSKPDAIWNIEVPHQDFKFCNPYHLTRFTEWTFRFFEPAARFFHPQWRAIMRGTAGEMNLIKLHELEQSVEGCAIIFCLRVVK